MKTPYKFYCILAACVLVHTFAEAQLNPFGLMYFQNRYLGNPAFAGTEKGINADLSYRKLWEDIPGTPITQAGTLSYGMTERAGAGLIFYKDKTGLINRTRVTGTYAYHVPLNGNGSKLSLGLALGFMDRRINPDQVKGTANDVVVGNVNSQDTYVDGDFGIAYRTNSVTVQTTIPNLKDFFNKERSQEANRPIYYVAVSCKFESDYLVAGSKLEPLLALRGVKDNDEIVDVGLNYLVVEDVVNMYMIYKSSGSLTYGMGVNYKQFSFNGMYVSATSQLKSYTNGNFELGLGVRLKK